MPDNGQPLTGAGTLPVDPLQTPAGEREPRPARGGGGMQIPEQVRPFVRWETALLIGLAAVIVFGIEVSSSFLTNAYLFQVTSLVSETAIMTLPMTLIIITGEIDLSVASTLGLCSAVLGELWFHHWALWLIFIVVIAVGAVAGAFNGLLITKLGLPSLAVTIGTLTLYRGLAIVILGPNTISNFPSFWANLGVDAIPKVPFLAWGAGLFLVMAVVFGVALHLMPFGRKLFAIGSNKEAAAFAGIRVPRIKFWLYVLSGVVCAVAGILYTFRLSTAVQTNAQGLELNVVAMVLLGGISIFGGKGTIFGVVLAVFVFAGLQGALFLTNFNQEAFPLVAGGLLLLSVLVPNIGSFVERGREAIKRRRARSRAGARAADATRSAR